MSINKKISIKTVLERVSREINDELFNWEEAMEYATEMILRLGSFYTTSEQIEKLTIEDYKASLPCNIIEIKHVRDLTTGAGMKPTTEITYNSEESEEYRQYGGYKINEDYITVGMETGEIEIVYSSLETDVDGLLLIPDNESIIDAVEKYLIYKFDSRLFRMGKIPQAVFVKSEQDYYYSIGKAKSEIDMPSVDEMENIKNIWINPLSNIDMFRDSRKYLGNNKYKKKH